MTADDVQHSAPTLPLRTGAPECAIAQAERDLAFALPADYRSFLSISNGACGFTHADNYIDLWTVETLHHWNREYGFPELCPWVVAFGSNGGGEAFAFRRDNSRITLVPMIGMELDAALDISASFIEFLRHPRPPHWK